MHALQTYVSALFTVFILLIFVRILLSFAPRPPITGIPRALWDFVHQSTDWFLNIFEFIRESMYNTFRGFVGGAYFDGVKTR